MAEQEMTLREYVSVLPHSHVARTEYDALVAALRAVTDAYWGIDDDHAGDGGPPPKVIDAARAAIAKAENRPCPSSS